MDFTFNEKKACIGCLMALADCDGPKNDEELDMLLRCQDVLDVTTDELLDITFTVKYMTPKEVGAILKPMSKMKKSLFQDCMSKIMEADGPANESEIEYWWSIQKLGNLPVWESRNNN